MARDGHRPVVLLTGASGRIGKGFRAEHARRYAEHYRLRLGVRRPGSVSADGDDAVEGVAILDVEDLESTRRALRGCEAVIHLAANPEWQADFCSGLVGPNLIGAYHVFEAARLEGVKRVVYASSVHAIMGYPVDFQAHHDDPPRPDTLYGVTKVFGEGLCSSYAYLHNLSCLAVRIGGYVPDEARDRITHNDNPQQLDIVVSQRDLAQLFHKCLTAPESVRYAIVNGLSNNRFKRMDVEGARALLGYEPEDDAFAWSVEVQFGEEKKV